MNQAVYFCTGEVQPALYSHYGLAMERPLAPKEPGVLRSFLFPFSGFALSGGVWGLFGVNAVLLVRRLRGSLDLGILDELLAPLVSSAYSRTL